MVRCEGTENKPSLHIAKAARADCFLAAPQLGARDTSGVASGLAHPILNDKTALVIQSVDGTLNGNSVKFGQPFTISTADKSVRKIIFFFVNLALKFVYLFGWKALLAQ